MIYIKDKDGKYKTLKEISLEYNVPLNLIKGRAAQGGIKEIDKLIAPKHARWNQESFESRL
jgi:hypothetical protein